MSQLHEILAIDKDREHQARVIMNETLTLWGKSNAFTAKEKRLEMFDEARQHEAESQSEDTAMTTTVPERLAYTAGFLIKHLDVLTQKESTNQKACADIVLDNDEVLVREVPATMLLNLERELAKYRQIFADIPTLDSSVAWDVDHAIGENVYRAKHPIKTRKTEKSFEVISLAAATKEHKEQVKTLDKDIVVGQYITQTWSGMISSAKKAAMLKRIDDLIAAVKKARMRANTTEVVEAKIGKALFDYILG